MVPSDTKPTTKRDAKMVTLELHPGCGVDVLGDEPPLLLVGWQRDFTHAEADALLELRNPHGTPLVRIVGGSKS